MSDWTIRVPFRERDESLIDVAANVRELPADERAVTREIVLDAALNGIRTAAELLDLLDSLEPHERRAMLDRARAECGLESTADIEARERVQVACRAVRATMESPMRMCAADGCGAIPTTESGAWRPTNVKRWWCEEHREQAAPGDMEPRPVPWRLSPSGSIIPNDQADEARDDAAAASRRAERDANEAQRAIEAAERREHDRALREQLIRETPDHFYVPPEAT